MKVDIKTQQVPHITGLLPVLAAFHSWHFQKSKSLLRQRPLTQPRAGVDALGPA